MLSIKIVNQHNIKKLQNVFCLPLSGVDMKNLLVLTALWRSIAHSAPAQSRGYFLISILNPKTGVRKEWAGSTPIPNTLRTIFENLFPCTQNWSSLFLIFFPTSVRLYSLRHSTWAASVSLATLSRSSCSHSLGGVVARPHLPLWLKCLEFEVTGDFWLHRTSWWSRGKPSQCTTVTGDRNLRTGFAIL